MHAHNYWNSPANLHGIYDDLIIAYVFNFIFLKLNMEGNAC